MTRDAGLLPLDVRDLHFAADNKPLVNGVDLQLRTGSLCTVLMGPNGAGKSLLLRLLHGLLTPTRGSVHWNGRRPDAAVRRRQSFVFQRPVLLRRSVLDNIEFVHRHSAAYRNTQNPPHSPAALLALAGLEGRETTDARQLSGGEQQRLALACALANTPEVLMLDEPTASLDPSSTAAIESILITCRQNGTRIILVTHDAGQARRLADDVVFLARGRITEHTDADAFFNAPHSAEARHYLDGQLVL